MRRAFWIVSLAVIWSLIDYPFGLSLFLVGAACYQFFCGAVDSH